ncbi:MAG TPA: extracellular solute-binding protein [Anaerolineae bacterium]|nr:extracellular solute-binding protein [Anaerolineae bacterium]
MHQKIRNFIAVFILVILLLVGCEGESLVEGLFSQEIKTPESIGTTEHIKTSVALKSIETPEPTVDVSGKVILTIWAPSMFSPNTDSNQIAMFYQRLNDFEKENSQVKINVRIKASSGPGSLLATLINADLVAPQAKPSLVILPQTDMEDAAREGVIYPIGDYSTAIDSSDWYEYARELALFDGVPYGLPWIADALIIVANSEIIGDNIATWSDIQRQSSLLYIPANDPNAIVLNALYLSAGGKILDQQGNPTIQPEILEQVLAQIDIGVKRGIFSANLMNYQTNEQIWQLLQDGQADWVVTWMRHYLQSNIKSQGAIQLPSMGTEPYSLATGWLLCLSENDPQTAKWSMQLAEYLTAEEFLIEWTYAAGYLPVRPSSVLGWQDSASLNTIKQILISAHAKPENELLSSLGPILRESLQSVLEQREDPGIAAQTAFEQLEETTTE